MWVVSPKRLREFWGLHPHAEVPLRAWFTHTMSRTPGKVRAGAIPDSYLAMVTRHPLTSMRSENDLDAAQAIVDDL